MQTLKKIFSIRIVSFLSALAIVSVVGFMVRADGILYSGATGTVVVKNQSKITTDNKMSVGVEVTFSGSNASSKFTLPNGTTDTSIDVIVYDSEGKKVWMQNSVGITTNIPNATSLVLELPSYIDKKDYYKAFPDPDVSGNLVKVFITGSVTKKLYFESDKFKLFTYDKPFSIESAPSMVELGGKFIINGSGFTKDNVKNVYLYTVGVPFTILNDKQIEAKIPLVIKPGSYALHITSVDGLFDIYAKDEISVVDMIIQSVTPLNPLKDTNITIKGLGFVVGKIKNLFIGDIIVSYTLVSPTEITVKVPKDFKNGEYDVTIEDIDGKMYVSPKKITIANMTINSIDPSDITKSARGDVSFYINGAGFTKDTVKKVFVGATEVNWDIVNDTKLQVYIPNDFAPGAYTINILNNEDFKIFASDKITIRDAGAVTPTPAPNTGSGSGANLTLPKPKGGIVPDCNVTGRLNSYVNDKGETVSDNFANPCDFNKLIELVNNIIDFMLIYFATPLAAIVLVYAGFLYLTSGGSSEKTSKAKHMLGNMIMGYIIALAAWLIIKTILTTLGFNGMDLLG